MPAHSRGLAGNGNASLATAGSSMTSLRYDHSSLCIDRFRGRARFRPARKVAILRKRPAPSCCACPALQRQTFMQKLALQRLIVQDFAIESIVYHSASMAATYAAMGFAHMHGADTNSETAR